MREDVRVVAVFQHARGPGRQPLVTAYTRDFNVAWEGCCIHLVPVESREAKRVAIRDHKAGVGCRGPVLPAQRTGRA